MAMAVMAFIALIVACYEYFSHKKIYKHHIVHYKFYEPFPKVG